MSMRLPVWVVAICLSLVGVGCDDEESAPSPDVGALRASCGALCDYYVSCDDTFDAATCNSDCETESDRLGALSGDDCQEYVDLLGDYNQCLTRELTCDGEDPVCVAESQEIGDLSARDTFDCPGALD